MKIYIITHGDKKLGLGHVIRCLSLYQAFETEGYQPIFIAPAETADTDLMGKTNHLSLDWLHNPKKLFVIIKNADIVIFDSPLAPFSFYKKISSICKIPVFIDDTKRFIYPRSIVINRTIYAEKLNYPQKKDVVYLLGTQYLPLTKAFWYVPQINIRNKIEKILITFGGSDPKEMTGIVLKHLIKEYPHMEKIVLVGRASNNFTSLIKIKDTCTKFYDHPTGEELKNLMLDADIAISAGGQTLFELARIGVPTIAIQIVDNQRLNIKGLTKAGFTEYAGNNIHIALKNLDKLMVKLANKKIRKKKSDIGRNLIDGYGSVRITNFLLGMNARI
jgi:UDP-2,4-diacetamido-2,4,6-trideoxy-beta-L-altropyranose hydrolase